MLSAIPRHPEAHAVSVGLSERVAVLVLGLNDFVCSALTESLAIHPTKPRLQAS